MNSNVKTWRHGMGSGKHRAQGRASLFGRAARRGDIAHTPTMAASQILASLRAVLPARGRATVPTMQGAAA